MRSNNESLDWHEVNGGGGYDVLQKVPMHEVGMWRKAVGEVPMGSDKGSDGLRASWDGLGGSDSE